VRRPAGDNPRGPEAGQGQPIEGRDGGRQRGRAHGSSYEGKRPVTFRAPSIISASAVANVAIKIPTLRIFRVLISKRLIGACVPAPRSVEVAGPEEIEAGFGISLFANELRVKHVRRIGG
jgi:hypothetical protein